MTTRSVAVSLRISFSFFQFCNVHVRHTTHIASLEHGIIYVILIKQANVHTVFVMNFNFCKPGVNRIHMIE